MDFQEAESKYFELKGRLSAGKLTAEQFQAEVGELRVQDDEGRHWAVDSRTGGWLLYDGAKWASAQPPGSVAVPPPPPVSAAPTVGGTSRVLLVGALAIAAVLCLVTIGGAGLILSRSGGVSGGEASAVSRDEAEAIADDVIFAQFPDMEGAEKVIGAYENPAGTKFWTVTYRQDAQAQFEGQTYEIPNIVVVSVDQDTGEAIVAVSS